MEILEAALVSSEQEDESESEGPHCVSVSIKPICSSFNQQFQ